MPWVARSTLRKQKMSHITCPRQNLRLFLAFLNPYYQQTENFESGGGEVGEIKRKSTRAQYTGNENNTPS